MIGIVSQGYYIANQVVGTIMFTFQVMIVIRKSKFFRRTTISVLNVLL